MARPKKENDMARTHLVALRLTDTEYDMVTAAAAEAGLSTSAYIRRLLLEGHVDIRYEIVADMSALRNLAAELGKVGNNLNQIAKYFHMGGARSKAMQDEIHECIEKIFEMREEIRKMTAEFCRPNQNRMNTGRKGHGSTETHSKQEQ